MKKLLTALVGFAAVLALALVLLPYLIPQSVLERQLRPLLAQASGLYLQEAQALRLSLYPEPGVALEQVRASFEADAQARSDVETDRITAVLSIPALWDGKFQLSKLVFHRPSVILAPDLVIKSEAELQADPLLIRTAAGAASEPRPSRPSLDVEIIDGAVFVETAGAGNSQLISDADLTLKSEAKGAPLHLAGAMKARGELVNLDAVATPDVEGERSLSGLKLALRSEAGALTFDGKIRTRSDKRLSGRAELALSSGPAFSRLIGGRDVSFAAVEGASLAGDLDVTTDRLTLSDGVFRSPDAEGELSVEAEKNGIIRAKIENMALHGGRGQGVFTLDARQAQKIFGASLSLSDVDALTLSKTLFGFDWISGRAATQLEIAGGGQTPDEIVGTLRGTGRLTVTKGAIEGLDLPKLVAEASEAEFGNWRREAGLRTPFETLSGTYAIKDGVARTKDLSMVGPNVELTGRGKTDFVQESINYRLKAVVTAAEGAQGENADNQQAALTVPVVVQGDWSEPDIYPDLANALKDEEGLRGSAKLLGKSVEKLTGGQVKSDEFGKLIDGLFGGKKKKKKDQTEE